MVSRIMIKVDAFLFPPHCCFSQWQWGLQCTGLTLLALGILGSQNVLLAELSRTCHAVPEDHLMDIDLLDAGRLEGMQRRM